MSRRIGARAPALCAAVLALAACGAGAGGEGDGGDAPPEPVLIEDPHLPVLVGADTSRVFGPTLFAFFDLEPGGVPSPAMLETARAFQDNLAAAEPALRALGVRIVTVQAPPVALDLPAETDARAGPRLAAGSYGYLFADAAGHARRVTGLLDRTGLICTAVSTFGLTPGPGVAAGC